MRKFLIVIILINFLLALIFIDVNSQTNKYDIKIIHEKKHDIELICEKKDNISWKNIFETAFKQKIFGMSYALVIGVGNYEKDWQKLEAPFYDACRVTKFLINDENFDNVITLTNANATKRKINKLMEETFPERIKENDRFLFYFSGHGTQRKIDEIPFGYLVLQNCGMNSYGDMISMDQIERWDNLLSKARHVLFILDCCFSGLAGTQTYSPLTDKKIDRLSQYAHYLITAGSADEKSVSSLKYWQGSLFTDAFLKGANGRADLISIDNKADGVISLKELMKYIEDRIDDESDRFSKGIKMSPQMSRLQESVGEFFFITKDIKIQMGLHSSMINLDSLVQEKLLLTETVDDGTILDSKNKLALNTLSIEIIEISGESSVGYQIKGIVKGYDPEVHEIMVYVEELMFDYTSSPRFYNQADRLQVNEADGTWTVMTRPGKVLIYVLQKGMVRLDMEPVMRSILESRIKNHLLASKIFE